MHVRRKKTNACGAATGSAVPRPFDRSLDFGGVVLSAPLSRHPFHVRRRVGYSVCSSFPCAGVFSFLIVRFFLVVHACVREIYSCVRLFCAGGRRSFELPRAPRACLDLRCSENKTMCAGVEPVLPRELAPRVVHGSIVRS